MREEKKEIENPAIVNVCIRTLLLVQTITNHENMSEVLMLMVTNDRVMERLADDVKHAVVIKTREIEERLWMIVNPLTTNHPLLALN